MEPYGEDASSPRRSWNPQSGLSVERSFRIAFDDLNSFCNSLISSGFEDLPLADIRVDPRGCITNNGRTLEQLVTVPNTFEFYSVVANYGWDSNGSRTSGAAGSPRQTRRTSDNALLTYDAKTANEYSTQKGRNLYWVEPEENTQLDSDITVPRLRAKTVHTYQIEQFTMSSDVWTLLAACIGKVNDSSVTLPVRDTAVAAQHLLFVDYSVGVKVTEGTFNGPLQWTLNLEFMEDSIGWNKFWNPTLEEWVFVSKAKGSNDPVYELANLNKLINGPYDE